MQVAPLVIEILDTDAIDGGRGLQQRMEVQYNPTQYSLSKSAQIAEIAIPGLDAPLQQFIRGQTEKLTVELLFDTSAQGMGVGARDVQTLTGPMYELVRIQPKTHAPPRLRLTWGHNGLSFKAIAETIDQKFVLFSPEGIPLRATLTMTFRGYATLEEQLADLKLESADQTKQHVVTRGETLSQIAFQELGDPAQWRVLADANPGVDLLDPTPGTSITIPPIAIFGVGVIMTAQPIYIGQDFYVPGFEMRLRGANVPRDVIRDVMQVSFKDSLTDVDSFDITINNWDAGSRTFKYSDDYLFDPGSEIELWMGYHDSSLSLMITGEIVELRPSFPSAGQPTLVIHGLDLLHQLRKEQRSKAWVAKTDTEIARQIASDLGIALAPQSPDVLALEPRYDYLIQDNAYDIIFLLDRARRIGYDLRVLEAGTDGSVQDRQLYFAPSTSVQRPTYELVWGKSLVEFQPSLSTANQVGSVTVRGWDAVRKQKFEHTATLDDLKTRGLGPQGRNQTLYRSFSDRKEVVATKIVASQAEAEQLALQTLQIIAKGLVTGTASVPGLPDLRTGNVVMISGIGTRFDGRYFVTDSTHTISDAGYVTQFGFRREEIQGSA